MFGVSDQPCCWSIDEFIQWVHADDRKAVAAALKRTLARGGYAQDYRIVRADGEIRWLRGIAKSVTNAAGDVTNLIGAVLDITDLKRMKKLETKSKNIRLMIRYIESNWSKPLSIVEIVAECGVSARSIHGYFASLGTTPMKFMRQMRLQRAR
jgi:hypothetical protein